MSMSEVLKRIVTRDRMLISRLGVALASFLWGAQLLLVSPQPSIKYLAFIAPVWVWVLAFFTQSLVGFYTLSKQSGGKMAVWGEGVLGGVIWTISTASCATAYWNQQVPFVEALREYQGSPGMPATIVISLFAWWNMVRLWADEDTCFMSNRTTLE